jgi:hypothetical protein
MRGSLEISGENGVQGLDVDCTGSGHLARRLQILENAADL